jgi:hypothetical protein
MPIGIVKIAALNAFIIKIDPKVEPLNPSEVKYSCKTTLKIPLAMPWKITPVRNILAEEGILSGIIEDNFNIS